MMAENIFYDSTADEKEQKYDLFFSAVSDKISFTDAERKDEYLAELKSIIDDRNKQVPLFHEIRNLLIKKTADERLIDTALSDYDAICLIVKEKGNSETEDSLFNKSTLQVIKKNTVCTKRKVGINRYQLLLIALLLDLEYSDTAALLAKYTYDQALNMKNPLDALVFIALQKKSKKYPYWKALWNKFSGTRYDDVKSIIEAEKDFCDTREVNNSFIIRYNETQKNVSSAESRIDAEVDLVIETMQLNYAAKNDIRKAGVLSGLLNTIPNSAKSYTNIICGESVRAKQEFRRLLYRDDELISNFVSAYGDDKLPDLEYFYDGIYADLERYYKDDKLLCKEISREILKADLSNDEKLTLLKETEEFLNKMQKYVVDIPSIDERTQPFNKSEYEAYRAREIFNLKDSHNKWYLFNEAKLNKQRTKDVFIANSKAEKNNIERSDLIYVCLYHIYKNRNSYRDFETYRDSFIEEVNDCLDESGYGEFIPTRAYERFVLWSMHTENPLETIKNINETYNQLVGKDK